MEVIGTLNRLVVSHHRSLARYLSHASPTWLPGDDLARKTLASIATDQERLMDSFGELILELNGAVQFGSFPMSYTGLHDLSIRFLLGRLLVEQRAMITTIEECIALLDCEPRAKAQAQEALGTARGHLELLEQIEQRTTGADAD